MVGAASGRNGGHVNNGTAVDIGGLAAQWGLDQARALYHAYDDAVDTVERIQREQQIACDFGRVGKIKLAAKPAHYEKMARGFEMLNREVDADTELVPPERIRDEVGSDLFHGGVVYPQERADAHGPVRRRAGGRGGAAWARACSSRLPVTALKRLGGAAHLVTTPRGSLRAKQVLVATGASQKGPFFYFRAGWCRSAASSSRPNRSTRRRSTRSCRPGAMRPPASTSAITSASRRTSG